MSGYRPFIGVFLLAVATASCATVQARTEPVMPELNPPPPPPRIVETYREESESTPVTDAAPPDAAVNTATARVTTKPAPRVETPTTTAPKPEPARTELERPTAPPPALTLKPAPGSESTTEGSIRTFINRASRDLARVNYTSLTQDGKAQYDTAKRFMQQAEEALRGGNLVFAGKLADKAATMAAVLVR